MEYRNLKETKGLLNLTQKRKLNEFMSKHPELANIKFAEDFTHKDAQCLWQELTTQLNKVSGGAKKTWKQWRKTWQDLKLRGNIRAKNSRSSKELKSDEDESNIDSEDNDLSSTSGTGNEKISLEQKRYLIQYMDLNTEICRSNPATKNLYRLKWNELAKELNKIKGANKTVVKWQRAWIDIKNKAKQKLKFICESKLEMALSPIEEKILKLMAKENGYDVVETTGTQDVEHSTKEEEEEGEVSLDDANSDTETILFQVTADNDGDCNKILKTSSSPSKAHLSRSNGDRNSTDYTSTDLKLAHNTANELCELRTVFKEYAEIQKVTNSILTEMLNERKTTNKLLEVLITKLQ